MQDQSTAGEIRKLLQQGARWFYVAKWHYYDGPVNGSIYSTEQQCFLWEIDTVIVELDALTASEDTFIQFAFNRLNIVCDKPQITRFTIESLI